MTRKQPSKLPSATLSGMPDHSPPHLDREAVRRAFGKAATTYDCAAVVHREIGRRMAERLALVRLDASCVLDAGCGTGGAIPALRTRWPTAVIVALDFALPMTAEVRRRQTPRSTWLRDILLGGREAAPVQPVCGEIGALPLADRTVDVVWSNVALHWCNDVRPVFAEFSRVLRVGGLLTFTTFGPDTLKELRAAFATVDRRQHTSRFMDMHDLGDLLLAAGFADPVMDMEMLSVAYPEPQALFRDLRQTGERNAANSRFRGLTGPRRWRRAIEAMLGDAAAGEGIRITWEVIYGHAWKPEPRLSADGRAIIRLHPRG